MQDLLAARLQMAVSLAFHILFAVAGIAMPVLMVAAEWRWQRTRDPVDLELAKRWSKGTAILFAVGAVSGTVLSFELGLLWPSFMEYAGPIIGMPFSLEGFAFFTEAIFLGIYLYGWDRISPSAHLASGVLVALSGVASGVFVVIANAWMNAPTGFRVVDGRPMDIDPLAAMATPAALTQTVHMTLAAFSATAVAVAGIHAWLVRRNPDAPFHRRALTVALLVAIPSSLAQPFVGHWSAQHVARHQPAKLAAMEAQFTTERGAPLRIGGWPDPATRTVTGALEIPNGLSWLAFNEANAEVAGLDRVAPADWPNVRVVHVAFQVMVGIGSWLALLSLWAAWGMWRGARWDERPALLVALAASAPLGLVAVEAGWVVTEVGRQPWIIQGLVRTADAVTPVPGLVVPFVTFTLLYAALGVAVVWLLWRQIVRTGPHGEFFGTREFRAPTPVVSAPPPA
jgi:cytochrome d ubiquinol oxidase subunit I